LKRFVKGHWKPDEAEEENESTNQFMISNNNIKNEISKKSEFVEVGNEEKKLIREILPRGLSDEKSQIRTAVGMVIASIAQWDWPLEWSNIIEHLAASLQSPNLHLVQVSFSF
jgi:hypothetical protein